MYQAAKLPQVCSDANGLSAQVSSVIESVVNFLVFLASPLLGAWSDAVGRRPVLIFNATVPLLSGFALLLFTWVSGFSLWFYLIAKGSLQMVFNQGTSIAYVADLMPPQSRQGVK